MHVPLRTFAVRPSRLLPGLPIAALALAGALLALTLGASLAEAAAVAPTTHQIEAQELYRSRLLWATIDICNASDEPDTLGVRGSMPGDGEAHDTMYMRFRLQYLNTSTKTWSDLSGGVSPRYVSVGSGDSARQGGRSFQLRPVAGQPVTIRGVVSFQWRRGSSVLAQISRTTSAGRVSLAGADPEGFSAASCVIG
jgi:hypothetical protein